MPITLLIDVSAFRFELPVYPKLSAPYNSYSVGDLYPADVLILNPLYAVPIVYVDCPLAIECLSCLTPPLIKKLFVVK